MITATDIARKTAEYKLYIDTHRKNVAKAWVEIQEKCGSIIKSKISAIQIAIIDENIKNHDLSKYEEAEFEAYRKWFHYVDESERDKAAFDKAWEHHYENNLHHPNSWKKHGNMDLMPYYFVVEMVADWQAMGYVFGNNAKEYYEKNKVEIQGKLGKKQIEWTEELLNALCE